MSCPAPQACTDSLAGARLTCQLVGVYVKVCQRDSLAPVSWEGAIQAVVRDIQLQKHAVDCQACMHTQGHLHPDLASFCCSEGIALLLKVLRQALSTSPVNMQGSEQWRSAGCLCRRA